MDLEYVHGGPGSAFGLGFQLVLILLVFCGPLLALLGLYLRRRARTSGRWPSGAFLFIAALSTQVGSLLLTLPLLAGIVAVGVFDTFFASSGYINPFPAEIFAVCGGLLASCVLSGFAVPAWFTLHRKSRDVPASIAGA